MSYVKYTQRNSSEYVYNMNVVATLTQGVLVSALKATTEIIIALFIFIFLAFQDPFALSLLIVLIGSFIFTYDFTFRKRIKSYGFSGIYFSPRSQYAIERI